MDQDALEAFAYIAMYVAHHGDRQIGDDELHAFIAAVGHVADGAGVEEAASKGAGRFIYAEARGEDHAGFRESVRLLGMHLDDEARADAYRSLVQICAADGSMAQAEVELLEHLRKHWRLDD